MNRQIGNSNNYYFVAFSFSSPFLKRGLRSKSL